MTLDEARSLYPRAFEGMDEASARLFYELLLSPDAERFMDEVDTGDGDDWGEWA